MMAGLCYVIGVGNPARGDAAVGRAVAEHLRGRVGDDVDVVEHDGEVTALLEWLEEADTAILIDAAASGAAPGTIHRLNAHDGPLPRTLFALSTHGFGLAEAVELARAMESLPPACIVYAIEGANFEAGHPLSDAVVTAAREVTERVLGELTDQTYGDGHA